MKTFERFCEEISSIVECKIISWHGSNYITSIQAYKLLRYGYMLGGFNIRNIGIPLVFVENRNRIHEQTIIRDHKTLEDFYSAYKVLYINCSNKQEKELLQTKIVEKLYNLSMETICATCEFGG